MRFTIALALFATVFAYDEVMSYKRWRKTFVTNPQHEPHRGLAAKRSSEEWDTKERKNTYRKNLIRIKAHNKLHDNGKVTYRMGVNEFTDLTHNEFKKATGQGGCTFKRTRQEKPATDLPQNIAADIDWRDHGAVTPVKNQEQCGSCWAFSTTGSTEGAVQIATGTLTPLSEQQLVDCAKEEGNHGCEGGLMDYGFQYIIDNGGIDSEDDYPYTAKDGRCDKTKAMKHVSHINSFQDVRSNSVKDMTAALNLGPVSVAIEADKSAFQHYKSGVFSDPFCGTQLDHGVLAVCYNDDAWIVKNSWGATWGDKGYIQLTKNAKNRHGECGILSQPSYPITSKDHIAII